MSPQTKGDESSEGFDGDDVGALSGGLDLATETGTNGADRGRGSRGRTKEGGRSRPNPARFVREIRNELRQVAWPTRSELINYSMVVITVLVIMIALIFALNYGFGKLVLWLFQR